MDSLRLSASSTKWGYIQWRWASSRSLVADGNRRLAGSRGSISTTRTTDTSPMVHASTCHPFVGLSSLPQIHEEADLVADLAGVTVVELSGLGPASRCVRALADLGARWIR